MPANSNVSPIAKKITLNSYERKHYHKKSEKSKNITQNKLEAGRFIRIFLKKIGKVSGILWKNVICANVDFLGGFLADKAPVSFLGWRVLPINFKWHKPLK